jgi:hypothetical protein
MPIAASALLCAACGACSSPGAHGAQGGGTEVVATLSDAKGSARGEPPVSEHGSDVSDLPARFPKGDWLPLRGTLRWPVLAVDVTANGEAAVAVLDTGAQTSTMSVEMAGRLGLIGEDGLKGRQTTVRNANGEHVQATTLLLGDLAMGRHRWTEVSAHVVSGMPPDLLLIGADVLSDVDLYLAAEEGLVGVFAGGQGPRELGDVVVVGEAADRELRVLGLADGVAGTAKIPFVVDTGATNTSVPIILGSQARLKADVSYEAMSLGVGGDASERRGRFVLDPLALGTVKGDVGRVLALGMPHGEMGLLGADVLVRRRAMLSVAQGALALKPLDRRPPTRSRGPRGVTCPGGPCVSVAVVEKPGTYDASDMQGVCLQVDVDRVYGGKTLELVVTAQDPDLLDGGAIHLFLTADNTGAHVCRPLWKQLAEKGLRAGTPLSLRWVRTEGIRWPCDASKIRCQLFSGPLK